MAASRRKFAFRPNLGDSPLEERVVLSTVVRTQASLRQAFALNTLSNPNVLRKVVAQQIKTATLGARNAIRAEVARTFANGTPTAQQRADLQASAEGILSATALQLSNLATLLPGGSNLVPAIQRSLIGNQGSSLASRVDQSIRSGGTATSLSSAITGAIGRATTQRVNAFNSYIRSGAIATNSVDQNGVSVPVSQFIGTQLVSQLGNTLGSLAQSFPTVASTVLFDNAGIGSPTPVQDAFGGAYMSAVGLVAYQLRNGLALSPSLASVLAPDLRSALVTSTNDNASSLLTALGNLPNTPADFNTAASSAFTDAFRSLSSSISTAFSLPTSQTFSLSTGTIPGLFNSQFSTLGNGFLNGFGSGFPGFGVASTDFNANFATGFNNLVSQVNAGSGFTMPTPPSTQLLTGGGPAIVR